MVIMDTVVLEVVHRNMDIVDIQQVAVDIQVEALRRITLFKVVAGDHILKEIIAVKRCHLRYQDVTRVYRRIQVRMETDTQ